MEFVVSAADLKSALPQVVKCASKAASLPIMTGVLLKAEDGTLEMQANDLTMSALVRIPCEVKHAGSIVVATRMFESIVKNAREGAVSFCLKDSTLKVSFDATSYEIPTLSSADFPAFPVVDALQSIELPFSLLQEMAAKVVGVTAHDQSRPTLTGVLMECGENRVRFVATDSFRLALTEAVVETSSLSRNASDNVSDNASDSEFSVIIPSEALRIALSMEAAGDKVIVKANHTEILFDFGNTIFISRKIEGKFPQYKGLIPDSCTTTLHASIEELSQIVGRVAIVSDVSTALGFDIDADASLLTLTCTNNEMGSATEKASFTIEGDNCRIMLNNTYIKDCLSAVSHDSELILELRGSTQSAVFKVSNDAVSYLYLLMPINTLE